MSYSSIPLSTEHCDMGVLFLAADRAEINVKNHLKDVKSIQGWLSNALLINIPTFERQMEIIRDQGEWKLVPPMAHSEMDSDEEDFENCYADLSGMQHLAETAYLINVVYSYIKNREKALELNDATEQGFMDYCADNAINNVLIGSQALDERIEAYAPELNVMAAIRPMMSSLNNLVSGYVIQEVNRISGIQGVTQLSLAINDLKENLLCLSNDYVFASQTHVY